MIGTANLQDDLFIINGVRRKEVDEGQRHALATSILNRDDSHIMLWHSRLGHPNFGYLQKLLPKLFLNKT